METLGKVLRARPDFDDGLLKEWKQVVFEAIRLFFGVTLLSIPLMVLVLSLVAPPVAHAKDNKPGYRPGYGREVKKGWYWYEVKKEKPKDKNASPEIVPYLDPWGLPAEEFRRLLNETKDRAVAAPTVENVARYIELQDVARRKSVAFANVYQMVMQTHPEFSISSQYPSTTPGIRALTLMRSDEIDVSIREAAEDFAMVYFYRPDCRFCRAQDGILAYFVDKYSWNLKRVNIYEEPEAASRFNVSVVPYILVVYRETGKYMPVSAGVVSLTDLEERLYRSIRFLRGDTSPARFSLYEYQVGGAGDPETHIKGARRHVERDETPGLSTGSK